MADINYAPYCQSLENRVFNEGFSVLKNFVSFNFSIWFWIGFAFALLGIGSLLHDFFKPGISDFNYSALFVTAASMFALHVLEVTTSMRLKERQEDRSAAKVKEVIDLSASIKSAIFSEEIAGINLRYRNAATKFSFLRKIVESHDLTDFDRERANFYGNQLKEELRAYLQTLHPCYFYGEIYESAVGKKYSREDFKYRPVIAAFDEQPELAECEIELERLNSKDMELFGVEFLFYSNAEDLNSFVQAGSMGDFIKSFKSVWLADMDSDKSENLVEY